MPLQSPERLAEILLTIQKQAVAPQVDQASLLKFAIDSICQANSDYNWVGIYILEKNGETLLLHDYYVGRRTTHTRIPVNEGICGAAVRKERTLIVDDVKSDPRYLSCSIETQSEIVVPIWRDRQVIAEIDIDSDHKSAFDDRDQKFLEQVARALGPRI